MELVNDQIIESRRPKVRSVPGKQTRIAQNTTGGREWWLHCEEARPWIALFVLIAQAINKKQIRVALLQAGNEGGPMTTADWLHHALGPGCPAAKFAFHIHRLGPRRPNSKGGPARDQRRAE